MTEIVSFLLEVLSRAISSLIAKYVAHFIDKLANKKNRHLPE